MWVLPTLGRPERCQEALNSIIDAGTSTPGIVIVNGDSDPRYRSLRLPAGWKVHYFPENIGFLGALNWAFKTFIQEPWYGLLNDDCIVRTFEWDAKLVEAAGNHNFANSNDGWQTESGRMHGAIVFGGDLLRAMGWWCPPGLWHCFADDCWEKLGTIFKNRRYLPEVLVEHKHVWAVGAPEDETHRLGYAKLDEDRIVWQAFIDGTDFIDTAKRVGKELDIALSFTDTSKFVVAICTPMNGPSETGFKQCRDLTINHLNSISARCHIIESQNSSHVGKGREQVLWQAMRTDATHILFIDADMTWNPMQVQKLLCSPHEFSCIVGVKKQEELAVCCNFLPNPQKQWFHPETKFLQLCDVGFAFVMLQRSVAERMLEAYPDLQYKNDVFTEAALFLDMMVDDEQAGRRLRMSEDYAFCRRWRAIGGEIWCEPHEGIGHIGRKIYTGSVSDFFEQPDEQSEVGG